MYLSKLSSAIKLKIHLYVTDLHWSLFLQAQNVEIKTVKIANKIFQNFKQSKQSYKTKMAI